MYRNVGKPSLCILTNPLIIPRLSEEDSASEDEDNCSVATSEQERRLSKRHCDEIDKYIEVERNKLTRLLQEFPEDTKLTRKKAK